MPVLIAMMLAGLVLLAGCQTKGERQAPCPPISSYAPDNGLCGPARPVNDPFAPLPKD